METRHHQHYALDGQGNLVHIKDTSPGEGYYCISCGEEMIPKKGEKNEHHFAHKQDTPHCSSETYLHELAKRKISRWLEEQPKIDLKLTSVCKKQYRCRFEDTRCEGPILSYNIKDLFNYIGVETKYGEYIPDILLLSKQKKQPLFIEIYVTHACTPKKRASGFRIIEFEIDSERDIERIVESNLIEDYGNIRLYGFKKPKAMPNKPHTVGRITIYKSGKPYSDEVNCLSTTPHKNALCQILVYPEALVFPDILTWATNVALQNGYKFKTCYICQHSKYNERLDARICQGYRMYNIPRDCRNNNADTCPHFSMRPNGAEYVIEKPTIQEYCIEDCSQVKLLDEEDYYPKLNFGE